MADNNFPKGDFSGTLNETIVDLLLQPDNGGTSYDDIFKNSHVKGCTFDGVTVKAGLQRENAWDANNDTRFNTYRRLKFDGGHSPAIYLKGGFCDNRIDDVEITKIGDSHSDWYEGDYSDQSRDKNRRNTRNNVRRSDGKPVRVAWTFFRAEKPRFTNSKVTYQYLWSFVRTIYVECKYLYMRFKK